MEDKITIIEGPTPSFELVEDIWANGIIDGSSLSNIAVTHLRTFNGDALVERCYKAWNKRDPINLEFRSMDGSTLEVPIVAVRSTEGDDGQLLLLWVRLPEDQIEIEFDFPHDADDPGDDDSEPGPLDALF